MRTNTATRNPARTHEGAPAIPPRNAISELRRAVASCLLWEDQFYESGEEIGKRITRLVGEVMEDDGHSGQVMDLAREARNDLKLRHVPLQLIVAMARHEKRPVLEDLVAEVVQRADEMGELLSLYWKDGRRPIAASLKRGLARAFGKFDAYQLGKYNRDTAVKLRDILRLLHPKPRDPEQAALWKRVLDGTLESPDTWEVGLSAGKDKRETFERLIREGRLGYLALLRNLRKMAEVECDPDLIREAIIARKGAQNVLPFRFVAAARAAPQFEPAIDEALCGQIEDLPVLPGRTVVLVDVSASMDVVLSAKSDMTRMDAAATLASIVTGNVRVLTFSNKLVEVPPRRGMAGIDVIRRSQTHSGTYLGMALKTVNATVPYDRIIVITDEQSHDPVGAPLKGSRGYMLNVASYQNRVGYGDWTRIEGFSESVLRFIHERERRDD